MSYRESCKHVCYAYWVNSIHIDVIRGLKDPVGVVVNGFAALTLVVVWAFFGGLKGDTLGFVPFAFALGAMLEGSLSRKALLGGGHFKSVAKAQLNGSSPIDGRVVWEKHFWEHYCPPLGLRTPRFQYQKMQRL